MQGTFGSSLRHQGDAMRLGAGGCHVEVPHWNYRCRSGKPAVERGPGESASWCRSPWGREICSSPLTFTGGIAPRPFFCSSPSHSKHVPQIAGYPQCHEFRSPAQQPGGARTGRRGCSAGRLAWRPHRERVVATRRWRIWMSRAAVLAVRLSRYLRLHDLGRRHRLLELRLRRYLCRDLCTLRPG
jgi:hypothetical protein